MESTWFLVLCDGSPNRYGGMPQILCHVSASNPPRHLWEKAQTPLSSRKPFCDVESAYLSRIIFCPFSTFLTC